jgi:predicted nucleic acid-binding protein
LVARDVAAWGGGVIVVDTSVLVDFFRGSETSGAAMLAGLERDGVPFALPAICCQELLAGARDEAEWDLLLSYLETQPVLSSSDAWVTHAAAARIMFDCRRRGLTIRSAVDCLIAQLVLEVDGTLLHADADFDAIAKVRPLRTLR